MYDVAIVGAGVIGCAIARELSRYDLSILLLDKENDVSGGASKANSGIVHGGYDAKYGTMKARFSRAGNRRFASLDAQLNFGYKEVGSLVLAFDEQDFETLEALMANGKKNGVNDLKIISQPELRAMEPHISDEAIGALYCPTAGITSPYELTIALAENAVKNGVTIELNQEVMGITVGDGFTLHSGEGHHRAKYVINAAGAYADKVAAMVGADDFHIIPRRGEYVLLNKNQGHLANRVLFQCPTDKGKGILVTRTYHGNLMLGPNAQEVTSPEAVGTNKEVLDYIVARARHSVPDFDLRKTLTSFSGIRATSDRHDFIIEASRVKGFVNVAGIESPGLTASPAIAIYVADILKDMGLAMAKKPDFDPYRAPIIQKKSRDFDGVIDGEVPEKNIVCRCEQVTEAEIVDALNRGIEMTSTDAVKRRTRAGMGPCQGHFCGRRVAKIIAREKGIPLEAVTTRGKGSSILPPREDRRFWQA